MEIGKKVEWWLLRTGRGFRGGVAKNCTLGSLDKWGNSDSWVCWEDNDIVSVGF